MQTKDYFIKDSGISAYTINAFVEAIVEATKAGQSIDYNSARRIGMSFSASFAQTQEETSVETQAPAQEEAPESPAQPEATAEESSDERAKGFYQENASDSEGESGGEVEAVPTDAKPVFQGNEQPFTLEDIEQAKGSMAKLNELAEPVGISGRSKADVAKQLREYIGA
ncbi:MAG: hypothetical protein Tp1111DCM1126091_59 [Prokaryotic dsDNA virus sp.]|nr:MAG: hypothetical protein Tp1111DCM1126091_59 [Prokaryotic dsDNA virus sp.]